VIGLRDRRRYPAVIVAGLALCVSACSSGTPHATPGTKAPPTTHGTTAPSSTTTTTTATAKFLAPESDYGTGAVGAPNPTTTVPTERGNRPINVENDAGQEVVIGEHGQLAPEMLVADVSLPITWTNLSGAPQQIVFNDAPLRSPVIAPGQTFTWTSPGYGISLAYHLVNGATGRMVLQNPNTAP
jgi:hypothetical protein